jgi:hypothetical protein
MATTTPDSLPNQAGFSTNYDWKNEYVSKLTDDGYERFSQYSANPDATSIFAGPARFSGIGSDAANLYPIGLSDGLSMSSNPQLAQLFEIGSNRSFFTRGKTTHTLSLGKMLADQQNILSALSYNAYRPNVLSGGTGAPGADYPTVDSPIKMNIDSEYFNVPFGIMLLFKTRGGGDGSGKILTALYLESCMFSNYSFSVASQSPVIVENIAISFDRPVPVAFN